MGSQFPRQLSREAQSVRSANQCRRPAVLLLVLALGGPACGSEQDRESTGRLGGIASMVGINPTAMTIWESRE